MKKNEQIDKISKKLVKLKARNKRFVKLMHKRYLRRFSKNINNPNPQHNRYCGYIG